jgi:hypothetical protein
VILYTTRISFECLDSLSDCWWRCCSDRNIYRKRTRDYLFCFRFLRSHWIDKLIQDTWYQLFMMDIVFLLVILVFRGINAGENITGTTSLKKNGKPLQSVLMHDFKSIYWFKLNCSYFFLSLVCITKTFCVKMRCPVIN